MLGIASHQDSGSLEIRESLIENMTTIEIIITDLVPDSLYEFKVMTN